MRAQKAFSPARRGKALAKGAPKGNFRIDEDKCSAKIVGAANTRRVPQANFANFVLGAVLPRAPETMNVNLALKTASAALAQ